MKADEELEYNFSLEGNTLLGVASGRLDARTVSGIWIELSEWLRKADFKKLILDVKDVYYCDSVGVALLFQYKDKMNESGGECIIEGLREEFQELLNMIHHDDFVETSKAEQQIYSKTERVGLEFIRLMSDIKFSIHFIGEITSALLQYIVNPFKIKWREVLKISESSGVNALPIVALIGFLLGLIMSFQSAIPMQRFGAEVYVANLVAISLFRELGPLMTAVVMAGRTGSSFAAELGTMKVGEEIDALTTMGLNPIHFLVIPRMIAVILISPLLTIFFNFFGLVGGAIVLFSFDYPLVTFVTQVTRTIDNVDLFMGLFKSMVFGSLVGGIGCLQGLNTGIGASAVGESTTRSVVNGIIFIAVSDGIMSVLFFYMGI